MGIINSGGLVVMLVLVLPVIYGVQEQLSDHFFQDDEITQVLHHDNKLYVAGKRKLYILDKDAAVTFESNKTCIDKTTDTCKNVIKVFLINKAKDELITCGTGNDGICQVRNLSYIDDVNIQSKSLTLVSTNENRPAKALMVADNKILIVATFGSGFEVANIGSGFEDTYYPINTRNVYKVDLNNFEEKLKLSLVTKDSDYLIYFKTALQKSDFTYLTTNQKEHVNSDGYTSKLVRLCNENSSGTQQTYYSYSDIELKCETDGKVFNLIQDAVILDFGKRSYFIGAFTSGKNPENVDGDSAICVIGLDDITAAMQDAWDTFGNCSDQNLLKKEQRYFSKDWGEEACKSYNSTPFSCSVSFLLDTMKYVIGVTPLELKPIYTLDGSTHGHVTKMFERTLFPNKMDLHLGTSKGEVVKLNFLGPDKNLELYDSVTVHKGMPIIAFHDNDEGTPSVYTMIVASEKKVVKYAETNCSEFLTCKATMTGRNPLCGWCVYEGKSTWKSSCQDVWLSSLDQCVSLNLKPEGQHVKASGGEVFLTLEILTLEDSRKYRCVFRNNSIEINTSLAEKIDSTEGKSLKCQLPPINVHGNVALDLLVESGNENVLLSSGVFLFFDCGTYKRCGDCTDTRGTNCSWCSTENDCKYDQDQCISSKGGCPQLEPFEKKFIPSGAETDLTFPAKNLDKNTGGSYNCAVKGGTTSAATASNGMINCTVNVELGEAVKHREYELSIQYTKGGTTVMLDADEFTVRVYRCDFLGKDCSHCLAVNPTRYQCKWCTGGTCKNGNEDCTDTTDCPKPVITNVDPDDGSYKGHTCVTIEGTEFGLKRTDITEVKLVDQDCDIVSEKCSPNSDDDSSDDEDYEYKVPTSVVCEAGDLPQEFWNRTKLSDIVDVSGVVAVKVGSKTGEVKGGFTYKEARVQDINPKQGPIAGGTRVTFQGKNLMIGNGKVVISYNNFATPFEECISVNGEIQCYTPQTNQALTIVKVYMDGNIKDDSDTALAFKKLEDPTDIVPAVKKGFLSGGTRIPISGKFLNHANVIEMTANYGVYDVPASVCKLVDAENAICTVPRAPDQLAADLDTIRGEKKKSHRRKRETDCKCVEVPVVLKLDGVRYKFMLQYYPDPEFDKLGGGEVTVFRSDTQRLVLTGSNLNLVVGKEEIKITIGLEECALVELTEDKLECAPPKDQPSPGMPGAKYPEVNVTVGNLRVQLGYLRYEVDNTLTQIAIIAGCVGAGLFLLIAIGVICGVRKYRKVGKKADALSRTLNDMEMEIKSVAKEEFFHMHTTMTGVNKNLVERGFPYNSYQQYAFNTLFASDFIDNHPLLHDPVVTDDTRMKLKRGMDILEQLILNRFFLVSVLSTMEGQKKFFLKEKSNLAGNLCVILLGRMEYLQEVMKVLMTNLVEESTGKRTQKTLFRRCESITEKLLISWLYLCQYPKVKASFGSHLYLLFKAMQLTIESGPIDALTLDANYTLTEERLLKKWNNNTEQGAKDPKLEAKPLTLNVVVDQGQDIFECKVLDCDSITQVKQKCLNQIYVNYPASQLNVQPEELHLEWHEGFGGALNLQDVDNTSQKDGEWVRLNTLAHYSVKDKSNMALVDPRVMEEGQENYVNLAQITTDIDCNGSMDSTEPLTTDLDDEPGPAKRWHLVKTDFESSRQQKSPIAELYLNRLFTTKQCIKEYLVPLFDSLLNKDSCPPPTHFLYSFLDDQADKNKVDAETLHLWKSHSYLIRVWANLVRRPQDIFDVEVPEYVENSMDVLGLVLIDSCAMTAQKHTKDSPPQKLVFMNEVGIYREKVKDFFRDMQATTYKQEDLREYLSEVNKLQLQNTSFNKMSALYRFYQQLEPYIEDIIEDLSMSKEASGLQLDKKFEQVVAIMEEEV